MKDWIRRKIAMYRYRRFYEKMNPYYTQHPEEAKELCLKMRWQASQTNDKALHIFADHMEGWLKTGGHW